MVKKRQPVTAKNEPTPEAIERFVSGVDGGNNDTVQKESVLNPNAKRDYKAISVPFNEFEFKKLEELAEKTGRTKLNLLRWAYLKLSDET